MPSHLKPARMFTRLTETIARLEAELANTRKDAATHAARASERDAEIARHARERQDLEIRIQAMQRDLLALDGLNLQATTALDRLELSRRDLQQELAQARDRADQACAERDGLAARLDELKLVEEKKASLSHILDGVRHRLRRRELEEERAILNRQALAHMVPEKNPR